MVEKEFEWINNIPEGAFISTNPTYEVGKYFELYENDSFTGDTPVKTTLKYYFYDPTKHGYPEKVNYPVLILLHGWRYLHKLQWSRGFCFTRISKCLQGSVCFGSDCK